MNTLRYCARSALFFLVLSVGPATIGAHAILVDSTPKVSSTIKGPELVVNLRFNVRIDGKRSRLRLIAAAGGTASTLTLSEQSRPDMLQTQVTRVMPGAYTLQWQVLASDGHISQGQVPFTVN